MVMEQHHLPGPGALSQGHHIVGSGMAERRHGRDFLRQQLGIVDQHVRSRGQLNGGGVVLAPPVWSWPHRGGAVVGDVGDYRSPVADPVPERPAPLVRDLASLDFEPAFLELARSQGAEFPVAAKLAGADREVRR
jgi:hypothetical protein